MTKSLSDAFWEWIALTAVEAPRDMGDQVGGLSAAGLGEVRSEGRLSGAEDVGNVVFIQKALSDELVDQREQQSASG
jgi:hypothetical protein